VIPLSVTYQNAAFIYPPLHPSFPYEPPAQSTSCCGEKISSLLLAIAFNPYKAPIAEKAQHDPQLPWFLTLPTFPEVLQSTEAGGLLKI
jgi:hypothetical protein